RRATEGHAVATAILGGQDSLARNLLVCLRHSWFRVEREVLYPTGDRDTAEACDIEGLSFFASAVIPGGAVDAGEERYVDRLTSTSIDVVLDARLDTAQTGQTGRQ